MKYYSQFGEDKFLVENCDLPERGVIVDVGAGGIHNSNSLYFEKKGWFCLCIEPDKRHNGLSNRMLVDNGVVGSEDKEVDFVFHRYPELSGLYHDKTTAVKLPMFRLDTLLEKYNINHIDILSIDVEGNEMDVFNGFSFHKYKPVYIIVEHTNQFKGNRQSEILERLCKEDYHLSFTTQSNVIVKRNSI